MHRIETLIRVALAAAGLALGTGCGGDAGGGPAGGTVAAPDETSAARLEAEIAALERRAERLKDHSAVERLQRAYGFYVDRADWDAVVDLLTDDATAEYGGHGVYVGKDSIRELLYALGGGRAGLELGRLNDHIQLQPVVDVSPDGTTAEGRWRVLGVLGEYERYARWKTGPYENTYRKVDGRWKISRIHWAETFTVPFDGGPTTHLETDEALDLPPPDAPSTLSDEPWPAVSLLPFHYADPVPAEGRQGEAR